MIDEEEQAMMVEEQVHHSHICIDTQPIHTAHAPHMIENRLRSMNKMREENETKPVNPVVTQPTDFEISKRCVTESGSINLSCKSMRIDSFYLVPELAFGSQRQPNLYHEQRWKSSCQRRQL